MKNKAFSLIEMLTVMGIIAILMALSVPQLFRLRDRNTLQTSTTQLISLLRQQQIHAMNSQNLYGIYFDQDKYTLFTGERYIKANSANTIITLDYPTALTGIVVSSSQLIFASGSGEIISFDSLHHSLILEDFVHNEQSIIEFNSLGVPVSIK